MNYPLFTLFAASVLCLPIARAQDTPKPEADDPIASEVKKAKEEYQSAIEKANQQMMSAFAAQQKKLEQDMYMKVDQQIKLVEQLQEEVKAFEAAKLPKLPSMSVAASHYHTRTATARRKCELAFDKAAEGYRNKSDLVAAKTVLTDKEQFLSSIPVATTDTRRVWKGDNTTLTAGKGDVWHEVTFDGRRYTFKEVSRSDAAIELVDSSRAASGVYLSVQSDKVLMKWTGRDRDYRPLARGQWQKTK